MLPSVGNLEAIAWRDVGEEDSGCEDGEEEGDDDEEEEDDEREGTSGSLTRRKSGG